MKKVKKSIIRFFEPRRYTDTLLPVLIGLIAISTLGIFPSPGIARTTQEQNQNIVYIPLVNSGNTQTPCSQSALGAVIFTESSSGYSTGPYLESLNQAGYTGMAGTPTYDFASEYFGLLQGWQRVQVCNTLECLQTRAQHAEGDQLQYEMLAYGPERSGGVPDEEKYNLPWATQEARKIADEWGKPLIISYSTKQLHQEAEERGFGWEDPSEVIAMLAPYGDVWMIQAADEFWRLEDHSVRPILSQRVYPPGDEFRAEVEKWVGWIRAANPDIEIWIQLALHRIGVVGENEPSAELLLDYRESIADLVDGIYMMPIYGSVEQIPIASQEMVDVFKQACGDPPTQTKTQAHDILLEPSNITLIEEGWSQDEVTCAPGGSCMTLLGGYYYRIYENTDFPCGNAGDFHQFMVLDHGPDMQSSKSLFAKFLGGAVGFYYQDGSEKVYYPNVNATGILRASQNRNMFFRTSLSVEHAGGVTRKFRENINFRMLVPSYCSHDLYHGSGEFNALDGFSRWGYSAGMAALDYVQSNYNTRQVITYGGSAGAAGAFYIGKDTPGVAGIIMDSQAVDLSAINDACYDGFNVFGNAYPCFCPQGGLSCMEVLKDRIGFTFYSDEPYKFVQQGVNKPIFMVWNERDASIYAHLQFDNLDNAIDQYNPGGSSVAKKVCIDDPRSPPGPICNLHVPSGFDFPDSLPLVEEIYLWGLNRSSEIGENKTFIPTIIKN